MGHEPEEKGKASGAETESWATTGQPSMTKKVSTVKAPNHGPTFTERGNNCTGSRGPSRSPNRRDDYLQSPSPQKVRARIKKGSSPQGKTGKYSSSRWPTRCDKTNSQVVTPK